MALSTARFDAPTNTTGRRLVVAFSATVLYLTLTASAWAAWTPAITISPPTGEARESDVAVDDDGDSVIVWQRHDGTNVRVQARTRSAAGVLGPILTLSPAGRDATEPEVAVDPDGDAVFVWERFDGANIRVQARARSAAGVLSSVQTLSPSAVNATRSRVEVDATGGAIFAWQLSNGVVQGRARSAAGALGPLHNLSPSGAFSFSPDVAIDAGGGAVFAWTRFMFVGATPSQQIQTRARSAGGVLSPIQTLSPAGQAASRPTVAVNPVTGNAVFAWERSDGTNVRSQTRARTAGGVLSGVQTLSLAGADALAPEVAVDSQGRAVFAWERAGVIQARARTAGGTLSAIQTLSGNLAEDVEHDVDADGDAVFTWERAIVGVERIQARTRSAAGVLGAVQLLSAADARSDEAQVEVDSTGDAVSSWERGVGSARRIQVAAGP